MQMPLFAVPMAHRTAVPRQKAPKLTFSGPHGDSEDERGPMEGWSSSHSSPARTNATPKNINRTQADAMLQAQFEIVRDKQVVEVWRKGDGVG